jgi:small subunit ribosomal protein S2
MGPYIFGKRSTIHILDIRETVKGLLRGKKFLAQAVARGGDVLFVGTKRQARQQIREHATRVGMPFVAERWLGGTLTNFKTIRSRVTRLDELETAEADGTALEYSKKMIASRSRELRKIRRNLEGIRTMTRMPSALVIIDVLREKNALREAKALGIPSVCLIDTDSDPDFADIPIPGNDDAMRAIDLILTHLTDAVEEGIRGRKAPDPVEDKPAPRRRSSRPVTASAHGGQTDAKNDGTEDSAETSDGSEAAFAPATATEPDGTA